MQQQITNRHGISFPPFCYQHMVFLIPKMFFLQVVCSTSCFSIQCGDFCLLTGYFSSLIFNVITDNHFDIYFLLVPSILLFIYAFFPASPWCNLIFHQYRYKDFQYSFLSFLLTLIFSIGFFCVLWVCIHVCACVIFLEISVCIFDIS